MCGTESIADLTGTRDGGGGVGVRCLPSTGQAIAFELLDLHEAKRHGYLFDRRQALENFGKPQSSLTSEADWTVTVPLVFTDENDPPTMSVHLSRVANGDVFFEAFKSTEGTEGPLGPSVRMYCERR